MINELARYDTCLQFAIDKVGNAQRSYYATVNGQMDEVVKAQAEQSEKLNEMDKSLSLAETDLTTRTAKAAATDALLKVQNNALETQVKTAIATFENQKKEADASTRKLEARLQSALLSNSELEEQIRQMEAEVFRLHGTLTNTTFFEDSRAASVINEDD